MKQNIADFFNNSKYHMADITRKTPTFRKAIAMGKIFVGEIGFTHIKNETLPKGDVLKLAEIAGVQGAKNAWQQIPMCHPLLLDHIAVYLELEEKKHSVNVYTIVSTTAKTGVEMEALAAVNSALLTLYDLTKPVQPALTISDIRLLIKEGGKKGLWMHPDGIPDALQNLLPIKSNRLLEDRKTAIITLSDRASSGEYKDKSGAILQELLKNLGCEIIDYIIIPDESEQLKQQINKLTNYKSPNKVELIITTGGTGLSSRDITPETISNIADKEVVGIGELLRSSAAPYVQNAWLSRSLAAIVNDTLIIALPGSVGGVRDGVEALKPILSHALDNLQNKNNIH